MNTDGRQMKRYDIEVQIVREEGIEAAVAEMFLASEVQALLRAVAEEVKRMAHAPVCSYPMDGSECSCPRGKVLALLEVK